MNTTDKIMELVADYGDWCEARGRTHAASVAAEKEIRTEIEALARDAERYRWLTDDHAYAEMRDRAEDIGIRLRWIGKGASDAAIDAAMQEKQS